MASVRVLLVRAPGTNCDVETAHAWQLAGAQTRTVHLNDWVESPGLLDGFDIVTFPGGFCYGDDVSAGKILATELRLFLADGLRQHVALGGLILGICNGFQVLVKAGLLPGAGIEPGRVTLAWNTSGRYEDRWVYVKGGGGRCRFLDGEALMHVPVAHAEGRLAAMDASVVEQLHREDRVALQYVDAEGRCGEYPVNPNGSVGGIAGLTDETGQILGLMPHPERHVHQVQHPCWTRSAGEREGDGLRLFRAAVRSFG